MICNQTLFCLVPSERQVRLPDAITCFNNTQKQVGSSTQEKLLRTNAPTNVWAVPSRTVMLTENAENLDFFKNADFFSNVNKSKQS